jgi:AcrR family transcriptional regulator
MAMKKKMPKDRKEDILEKAVQLFLKKGYEKATLRDLGKAAGIQAPGVYYYFKSKKDILNQLHRDSWNRFRVMVLDQAKEAGDPEERIRAYVYNMIKFQGVMAEKNLMLDNSVSVRNIKGRKACEREVFEFLRDTLGEFAAEKGLENDINPTLAAFSLYAIASHVHHWYRQNGKLSLEEVAEYVIRLFLFGFSSGHQGLAEARPSVCKEHLARDG